MDLTLTLLERDICPETISKSAFVNDSDLAKTCKSASFALPFWASALTATVSLERHLFIPKIPCRLDPG